MINVDKIEKKIKMVGILKDKTETQVELFIREKGSAILVAEDIALVMELENLNDLEKAFEEISRRYSSSYGTRKPKRFRENF